MVLATSLAQSRKLKYHQDMTSRSCHSFKQPLYIFNHPLGPKRKSSAKCGGLSRLIAATLQTAPTYMAAATMARNNWQGILGLACDIFYYRHQPWVMVPLAVRKSSRSFRLNPMHDATIELDNLVYGKA